MRPPDFTLSLAASGMAVRTALADLRTHLSARNVPPGLIGTVELALAEALNNIVEHAYAPDRPGEILLAVALTRDRLRCTLRDRGEPLPDMTLPDDDPPNPGMAREALPEGGFGWFLIREMTEGLCYMRTGNENILTLEFALHTPDEQS